MARRVLWLAMLEWWVMDKLRIYERGKEDPCIFRYYLPISEFIREFVKIALYTDPDQ